MRGEPSELTLGQDDSCLPHQRDCDNHVDNASRGFTISAYVPPSARFEAFVPNVLMEYESRLRLMGSSLARDDETMRSCLAHAEAILGECAQSVRERRVVIAENRWTLSSEIGIRRATHNIHPIESLRASAVLVELAIDLLRDAVQGDPDAAHLMTVGSLAVTKSIAARMEIAAMSYDRFLFEQIRRAQTDITRTMAREIHDHVSNGMSLAHRQLELYEILHSEDEVGAHHKVTQARRVLTETLDNTRKLVAELRLDTPHVGVRDAVETFIGSMAVSDVAVEVVLNGDERWVPEYICGELFTVIREALRNVFKHANASKVNVRIDVAQSQVRASVQDNGNGFDPATPSNGHGLAAMAERTTLLEGILNVRGTQGIGTCVEVVIPFVQERYDFAHH